MIWVVMISTSAGYKAHSVHADKATALAWEACQQHNGDDTSVLELDKEAVESLREAIEKI